MTDSADAPPLRYRALQALARLYPLKSGCGGLASGRVAARFAPPAPLTVWTQAHGGRALAPLDDFVGRAAYFFGDLDPKISALVRAHARPGDTVLDIGGNIGLVTLCAARAVGPIGAVHVFEPNPRMSDVLRRVIAANPGRRIDLHEIALGRRDETLTLNIPQGNAGAASLKGAPSGGTLTQVAAQVRTLSGYAREIGLDRADLIKIDVEGFEADVLAGGADFIADARPRAIILEEHGYRAGDARWPESFRILKSLGYDMHAIPRALFKVSTTPLARMGARAAHDFIALRRP